MSVDPVCERCGEEYDRNTDHECVPNHQEVSRIANGLHDVEEIVQALVDYVEAREWQGVGFDVGKVVVACADCEAHKRGPALEGVSIHHEGCRWAALMRAAGRR